MVWSVRARDMTSPFDPQPAGRPLSRRAALNGLVGSAAGATVNSTVAADAPPGGSLQGTGSAAAEPSIWRLSRPKSALPNSFFWTWDHSTNWMLDDPGMQVDGCYNRYLKRPETFLEDYRRLTDLAAGLGIKGITIFGFLRDSHGGEDYARRVAAYAAARGVAIVPGLGTNWYRGPYYEGDHRFHLPTFLARHPDARVLDRDGRVRTFNGECGASPAHPAFREWLAESLRWLFEEFEIGGLNLENGDMLEDYNPLTQAMRKDWPAEDPEPFFFQGLCYKHALEPIRERLAQNIITYATYTGFSPTAGVRQNEGMGRRPPAMLEVLPAEAIAQWTLTGMMRPDPVPLTAYLDDGAPEAAFDNPKWPRDLRPPNRRSVGFLHQGSQWSAGSRYSCVVGTIKEACLRAFRAGLEGVSIHGEVTARFVPAALNYLAFSHFTHWPEDTLREFGRKTLGQVLGSEEHGEAYAEILAHWDAGTLTAEHARQAAPGRYGFRAVVSGSACDTPAEFERYHFWRWLEQMVARRSSRNDCGPLPI
jgi:hypothetical protein